MDDSSAASSCGLEVFEYLGSDPVELVCYDTMSLVEDELPSPLSLIGSRVGMRLLWRDRVFEIGRSTTT